MIMVELASSEWIAARDAASDRVYYVHKKTREARWVPPGDDDADAFVAEHLGGSGSGAGDSGGGGASSGTAGVEAPPQHVDSAVLTADGLFSAVDVDGSGEISCAEFESFWLGRLRAIGKQDDGTVAAMRSIFDDLDTDGSGARSMTRVPPPVVLPVASPRCSMLRHR